jgi:hypothetical protein
MPNPLYDHDFNLWLQQQSALLRQRRLQELDIEALADEVESIQGSYRLKIAAAVRELLTHMLLLRAAPDAKEKWEWQSTLVQQRMEIDDIVEMSPSLRETIAEQVDKQRERAVRLASDILTSRGYPGAEALSMHTFRVQELFREWPKEP